MNVGYYEGGSESFEKFKLKQEVCELKAAVSNLQEAMSELTLEIRTLSVSRSRFDLQIGYHNTEFKLYTYYHDLYEQRRNTVERNVKTYVAVAIKAIATRCGLVLSSTVVAGALKGGAIGTVTGFLGCSIILPGFGTVVGPIALGAMGLASGALIGAVTGMGAILKFSMMDYNGWIDMQIYTVFQSYLKKRLLKDKRLEQFLDPITRKLMWEPYSIEYKTPSGEIITRRFNHSQLKKVLKYEKESLEEILESSSDEESNDRFEEISLDEPMVETLKEDRSCHRQQYEVLKEVIEDHKLKIQSRLPDINRALDLIAQTYHPKSYGKNPDEIIMGDPSRVWRWFCTHKEYQIKKINEEEGEMSPVEQSRDVPKLDEEGRPKMSVGKHVKNGLLFCLGK